jgi:hypothetical protein
VSTESAIRVFTLGRREDGVSDTIESSTSDGLCRGYWSITRRTCPNRVSRVLPSVVERRKRGYLG